MLSSKIQLCNSLVCSESIKSCIQLSNLTKTALLTLKLEWTSFCCRWNICMFGGHPKMQHHLNRLECFFSLFLFKCAMILGMSSWDLFSCETRLFLFLNGRLTNQKFENAVDINTWISLNTDHMTSSKSVQDYGLFCISWSVKQHSSTWRFPFLKPSRGIKYGGFSTSELCSLYWKKAYIPLEMGLVMCCLHMMLSITFLFVSLLVCIFT